MNSFIVAWRFLTIVPLFRCRGTRRRDIASSTAYFPAVGLALGGALVLLDRIIRKFLPVDAESLVVLAFFSAVTGAIHLDGFADTVDGCAGGRTRGEILRIMRDSRVGAAGAAALVLLLLMKYLCMAGLRGTWRSACLAVMPCAGRWSMVLMAFMGPYARREGLGKAFVDGTTLRSLGTATAVAGLGAALFMGMKGLLLGGVVGALSVLSTLYFRIRLGGVTGDTMGAINETAELFFLLGALALS